MIKEGFAATNSELLSQLFDVEYSGSTAVTVLIMGRRLVCANVGDSRCVLLSLKRQSLGRKSWTATALSRDHKPTLPDESARILRSRGRAEPCRGSESNFNPRTV